MTEFLACRECREPFKESELERCYNCDDLHCEECDGKDERTCSCEPLCAACRAPPNQCKTCNESGCILCMGSGCPVCEEIEHDDFKFSLVCDDCRVQCTVCKREICFDHVTKMRSVDKKSGKCRKLCVCVDCTHEALNDLIAKRIAPLKGTASDMHQE